MKIAFYSDKPSAGKTTLANYLIEKHNYQKIKFAKVLKEMIFVFLSYLVDDPMRYIEGDLKETIIPALGCTCRHLMETLGHNWGRVAVNPDTWVIVGLMNIDPEINYVVDDVRYENEYKNLEQLGFILIKVVRPGLEFNRVVPSEGNLSDLDFDYTIYNSGSVADLYEMLDIILKAHEQQK